MKDIFDSFFVIPTRFSDRVFFYPKKKATEVAFVSCNLVVAVPGASR